MTELQYAFDYAGDLAGSVAGLGGLLLVRAGWHEAEYKLTSRTYVDTIMAVVVSG